MIVHLDLGPKLKKRFEAMLKELSVPVSSEEEAVLVFSKKPHPYKPTVIIGKVEDGITDNVIDILETNVNLEKLRLKMKLYEAFLQSGDYSEVLDDEFVKARRNTMPLSVVLFKILDDDIDALKALLSSLSISSRRSDKAFNLGEGEILVILPGTDKDGAEVFVRRLERRFVRRYIREKVLKKPSYTYAVAELEDWMITGEDLLSSAEYELLKKIR